MAQNQYKNRDKTRDKSGWKAARQTARRNKATQRGAFTTQKIERALNSTKQESK